MTSNILFCIQFFDQATENEGSLPRRSGSTVNSHGYRIGDDKLLIDVDPF